MTDKPQQIETPSGKGAADENFPVGSFLLPKRLRPHVATYYAFARAIDDIADNPDSPPQDKIARLNAMDDALLGRTANPGAEVAKATALRASMLETDVNLAHASDLLVAAEALHARRVDETVIPGTTAFVRLVPRPGRKPWVELVVAQMNKHTFPRFSNFSGPSAWLREALRLKYVTPEQVTTVSTVMPPSTVELATWIGNQLRKLQR